MSVCLTHMAQHSAWLDQDMVIEEMNITSSPLQKSCWSTTDGYLVKDGDRDGKGCTGVGNVHDPGQAALARAAGQQQVDLQTHSPLNLRKDSSACGWK